VIGSVLKFIGFIVVLVAAFSAGVLVASPWSQWDIVDRQVPADMVGASFRSSDLGKFLVGDDAGSIVFGVIRNVAGNTVTVADNGGGLQVVLSSAKTVIVGTAGELPLSALRVGQFIRVIGVPGEAGITARTIEIIR
jgi:hypothetical protein